MKSTNIHYTKHLISPYDRYLKNGHKSGILWFTGLSGAGKTTLALKLEQTLFEKGWSTFVLDGDSVRHGLCSDLGFSASDRSENIRRLGEVAKLFAESGCLVITAFISPYRNDREQVRRLAGDLFHEVYIATPLELCEQRDPQGLYLKARSGEIDGFTGISAPYEPPNSPDLWVETSELTVEESLEQLLKYVENKFTIFKQ
ncbi:adenylyl-sulfate kinase [Cylindrospermopsis raciborskii]|uniref:adenylyl-sulfate kinase n=1 Tax=Cylindrospermopsis raciborskii TaxID=77022 RepID=UPI000778DC9B|nr:adenylyl-sulfate kinase [Cylindrospermopsis raciborskii]MCZ2206709.1 adenylyl-sulfate kinase [Cylindrospermopsis raciborskii PAMP2011]